MGIASLCPSYDDPSTVQQSRGLELLGGAKRALKGRRGFFETPLTTIREDVCPGVPSNAVAWRVRRERRPFARIDDLHANACASNTFCPLLRLCGLGLRCLILQCHPTLLYRSLQIGHRVGLFRGAENRRSRHRRSKQHSNDAPPIHRGTGIYATQGTVLPADYQAPGGHLCARAE